MKEFKVGQFTKELVAARTAGSPDPCAAAADLIRETMRVALKNFRVDDSGAEKVFEDAVRGGMQGLLLKGQDVVVAGVLTLQGLVELSVQGGWDPGIAWRGALRGLAGLRRLLTHYELEGLLRNIEGAFPGRSGDFTSMLDAQPDPGERRPAL
ncbi:MAG: hypothetical protein KGL53_09540 [Elusimicrobia bacterium]|nr:hypothetical protein [Elusimicrobiota bacterium]